MKISLLFGFCGWREGVAVSFILDYFVWEF